MDELLDELHLLMLEWFQGWRYDVVLRDSRLQFSVIRSHPSRGTELMVSADGAAVLSLFFARYRGSYFELNGEVETAGERMEEEVRAELGRFGARYCFPLKSSFGVVGFLLLGGAAGGRAVTSRELLLLTFAAKTLAGYYSKIGEAEELELIGFISRGLAHDFLSLLVPISTFVQLHQAGGATRDEAGELAPVVLKNLAALKACLRGAVHFSRERVLRLQSTGLEELTRKAVELNWIRLKGKGVRVEIQAESALEARVDEVLLLRLLQNLLLNAIEASPRESVIRIELDCLPGAEGGSGRVRIRIRDQGGGISPDQLREAGATYGGEGPVGQEEGTVGLGLAISREIARLHGGDLVFVSEPGQGTTVQLGLPVHGGGAV